MNARLSEDQARALDDIGRNPKRHELARLLYVALTRPASHAIVTGALPDRLYRMEAA